MYLRGITSILLYKDGNFMQVLEGEEQTIRELYTISVETHGIAGLLF